MTLRIQSLADLPPAVRSLNGTAQVGSLSPLLLAPKPRKYGNVPVIEDGQRFDSKLELRCYQWLKLRQLAGEVLWFVRQVSFRLEGGVVCRVDYVAQLASGGAEVIDAKGMLTQSSANKYKQMRERYGIDVILWTGK